jgi:hypothetical protein
MRSWSYKAFRVLLTTCSAVVIGGLVWNGWSRLATVSGWARFAIWPVAALATFAGLLWFYRGLWRGDPLYDRGLFAPRGVLPPFADTAATTIAVWFLLTAPFAFGTYLFERDALMAKLKPDETARDAYYEATTQYEWHTADVIPFIKATDTLNWTEPSTHWKDPKGSSAGYSTGTGVLLVFYKLLVLLPVLAAGRAAWQLARTRRA